MNQYRKSPRAPFLDYDTGYFFITICTKNRKDYFGYIQDAVMNLNPIGLFLEEQLNNSKTFYDCIDVPLYVVMPNHVHFLIVINGQIRPRYAGKEERTPNPSLRSNPSERRHYPVLSKYIASLKGKVTKFAKAHELEFDWQERYHDHLIRGSKDEKYISEYILNNVAHWEEDCFNSSNNL